MLPLRAPPPPPSPPTNPTPDTSAEVFPDNQFAAPVQPAQMQEMQPSTAEAQMSVTGESETKRPKRALGPGFYEHREQENARVEQQKQLYAPAADRAEKERRGKVQKHSSKQKNSEKNYEEEQNQQQQQQQAFAQWWAELSEQQKQQSQQQHQQQHLAQWWAEMSQSSANVPITGVSNLPMPSGQPMAFAGGGSNR